MKPENIQQSLQHSVLLQAFTVPGGFLASLYAIHRITDRLKGGGITSRDLVLPYSFLAAFTVLFVVFMKTTKSILFLYRRNSFLVIYE